jgi:ubiquinone/menaquinone biosynthesis C-methylase UbiE
MKPAKRVRETTPFWSNKISSKYSNCGRCGTLALDYQRNPAAMLSANRDTSSDDPLVPDWKNMELSETWPDQLRLNRPSDLLLFIRGITSRHRQPVLVGDDLPGKEIIPQYVLQEFHNLPNGNYSKRITKQYIPGFERAMLGSLDQARLTIASQLAERTSVLDLGCGGGGLGAACLDSGAQDVWGLDPSPYLLQHAARAYPEVRFIQGVIECLPFPNARFHGVAACFVFHEVPPRYIDEGFAEISRVLKPGGLLAICEPSRFQMNESMWRVIRRYGIRGLYFYCLARSVYEPFVRSWHRRDITESLQACGLELMSDMEKMPVRHILARKLRRR